MNPELFYPKLNIDKPSLPGRVASVFRSCLGRSRYQEIYGELLYPDEKGGTVSYPAKAVLKDNQVIALASTFRFWWPRRFVEPLYVPSFAKGRCVNLTDGGYKVVIADEDGDSDTVIKRYGYHTYWGLQAQEKASVAATKLNQIYDVMMGICPQHILPTERFVHPMPYIMGDEEGWAVFERQKRAIFADPWLFEEPQVAERIEKDSIRLADKYHKKIVEKLIKQGICQVEPYSKILDFAEMNFNLKYDCLTRMLVADDIIDFVHIPDPNLTPFF